MAEALHQMNFRRPDELGKKEKGGGKGGGQSSRPRKRRGQVPTKHASRGNAWVVKPQGLKKILLGTGLGALAGDIPRM
jgi:hypothetical protein